MNQDRLQRLLTFLEANPKDSFVLFAIAKEYEKNNDREQALSYYLQIRENDPDYVGVYYHLGKLYEARQEIEKAFFTYKEGIEVARRTGDNHALSELAGAKLNLGEDEDFES